MDATLAAIMMKEKEESGGRPWNFIPPRLSSGGWHMAILLLEDTGVCMGVRAATDDTTGLKSNSG